MSDNEIITTDGVMAFSFGEPESVLDANEFFSSGEAWWNGQWYETPISMDGLSKSFHANSFHSSSLQVKRNLLVKNFIPHPLLPRSEFKKLAADYVVFGNAYVETIFNMLGEVMRLRHSPAISTRKTKIGFLFINSWSDVHQFNDGSISHLKQYDIRQEIYGMPEYISGLQDVWLSEAATLFRRRYYSNGGHSGYILYISDPAHSQKDVDKIKEALRGTKGKGNFKNLMLYAPAGQKDGVQVIPLSDIQAKDEFRNIKDKSQQAVIASHRVPIQYFGAPPENVGGYGDVEKADRVFKDNEIIVLQNDFEELNELIGDEVIKFTPFDFTITTT